MGEDVTGREVILNSGGDDRIASAIEAAGYVCVPREATPAMVKSAWASELAENASGVWDAMVGFCEGTISEDGNPVP